MLISIGLSSDQSITYSTYSNWITCVHHRPERWYWLLHAAAGLRAGVDRSRPRRRHRLPSSAEKGSGGWGDFAHGTPRSPCYLALAPTASASRRLGGTQAATRDTAPRSPSSLKRGAPRPQRVTQHHVPRLHTSRAELSFRRVPRAPRPRHRKRF